MPVSGLKISGAFKVQEERLMIQEILSRVRKAVTMRADLEPAVMESDAETAAILLDFCCEIHGGIRILAYSMGCEGTRGNHSQRSEK